VLDDPRWIIIAKSMLGCEDNRAGAVSTIGERNCCSDDSSAAVRRVCAITAGSECASQN
jgi:hypothetical protein